VPEISELDVHDDQALRDFHAAAVARCREAGGTTIAGSPA
jgi:hypothetical protein